MASTGTKLLIAVGLTLIIGSHIYQVHQYVNKQQELVQSQSELIEALKGSSDSANALLNQQRQVLDRIIKLYIKE